MTTRAPGLTAAMRRKLLLVAQGQNILQRDWDALCERDFAAMRHGFRMLTPRGQAALAAPRMTAAELAMLEHIEKYSPKSLDGAEKATFARLEGRGFARISPGGWHVSPRAVLTPTGLTALNNMRAAMGSAEYREDLK